jgi:formate hydrogenlyase subunit 4
MVLWGSVVALLASVAGLVTLGSLHLVGDLAALVFVISLFTLICATEAKS